MFKDLLFKFKLLFFLIVSCSFQIVSAQTETIYIDFGGESTQSAAPWNNITNPISGSIYNLVNSNSVSAGIGIAITNDFFGSGSPGTSSPNASLNFPSEATNDFFYGDNSNNSASLLLKNLVIGKDYTLSFFASRNGVADNRETLYTVIGATTQSVSLNVSNNNDNVVTIAFKAKADGTAIINVTKGINNNNSSGFFYLGVIKLEYATNVPTYSSNALLVDFGSSAITSASNWNNLTDPLTIGSVTGLKNNSGATTSINLAVTDAFNFVNTEGTASPGQSLGLPSTATSDSFFGNTIVYLGKTEATGAIKFTNFDPNIDLSLKIYSSRVVYTESDNRETQYTIEGLTTKVVYLDVANNVNNFVSTTVKPKADGSLTVTATKGPNNTNSNGFFYLGAMIIDYTSPPASVTITSPNGGEFWQVGKTTEIAWNATNLSANIALEYSTDNGLNWNPIATVSNTTSTYSWVVPSSASTGCLVRATSGTVNDTSDAVFEISNDNTTCNIVVIGSSTAEGIGASTLANSWVGLYTKAVYQKNTKLNVINLGKGGYTTYHVLPTGTPIPSGVNVTIDTQRNISKALSYNPIAVIVNMPSNDTENGYSVADQMANYATLYNEATNNTTPIWIATTQPRNFSFPSKIQQQIDVRDGILSTYGAKAINFWTNVAETDGTILATLNSGDGVHLNNAGHTILYNKVLNANIQNLVCDGGTTLDTPSFLTENFSVAVFPNPVKDEFNLKFNATSNGVFTLALYDVLGKQILSQSANYNSGETTLRFSLKNIQFQIIIGKIVFKEVTGTTVQKQFKLSVK